MTLLFLYPVVGLGVACYDHDHGGSRAFAVLVGLLWPLLFLFTLGYALARRAARELQR